MKQGKVHISLFFGANDFNNQKEKIMLDWLQFWITDHKEVLRLWDNPLLYFKENHKKRNDRTGEIFNKQTKEFKGITFRLEPHWPKNEKEGNKRIVIGFKPHYWFNNNKHNANDFTLSNSMQIILGFIGLFEIENLRNYQVNNLEYGVNFIINGYSKELITFNSYHSRKQFIQDDLRYSKKAINFNPKTGKVDTYLKVKLYSKGFQFPNYCDNRTLRFEISTKKSKKINALGIYNIGDLLKEDVYFAMKKDLLTAAKNVLIINPTPILKQLNKREENLLQKYSNDRFWYNAINQKRPNAFNEKKQTYFRYLDQIGQNISKDFYNAIDNKLQLLFKQNGNESPGFLNNENGNYSHLVNVGIVTDKTMINYTV
ncbi:hypothetical protein [Maribacter arcticus]|uniref:Uncharacterized protein n=1 Tax=Maribacter arcticus TaxID=561365 RepID=A0A1T5AJP4_9FLAO|nr:hypothetical protein [Maribacter arcticus]SKB35110.1 hypothetical protein SAMN05660866_01030 [Maribacter arcticus]